MKHVSLAALSDNQGALSSGRENVTIANGHVISQ